jgi:hypothetical protein
MSIPMIATKDLRYATRRLKAGDGFRVKCERDARVLVHLKKAEREDNENRKVALDDARAKVGMAPLSKDSDDIKALRDEYFDKFGKRAFNGWSADQLKEKLAGA